MAISQRSTSTASVSSIKYAACDRWQHDPVNGGVWTISQEALTADEAYEDGFSYAYKMDCTTASASPAASDLLGIRYRFEGQDVQLLKKGTSNAEKVTVAFWVKATKTGNNVCNLYDDDNARVCSLPYTISSTNTWEHKVLNFPADTTGVLTNNEASSLRLYFFLQSGTTYNSGTQPTTWEAYTNADWCVGQVNHADSTSNNFHVTGVQMEVGEYTSSDLPPFQHEFYGDNLQRCQRYYEIADRLQAWVFSIYNTTNCYSLWKGFATPKRTTVDVTVNGTWEGYNDGTLYSGTLSNQLSGTTSWTAIYSSTSLPSGEAIHVNSPATTKVLEFDAEF